MAMIKGFQLKAVKNFRGHEGEPLKQGNLYFGNKKAGFVSEDAHGGYPTMDVLQEFRGEWEKSTKAFEEEFPEKSVLSAEENFFYELLKLTEDEKTYKTAVKKGYPITAHFAELQEYPDGLKIPVGQELILSATSIEQVDKYEEREWKGKLYEKTVFTSLEDFVIA